MLPHRVLFLPILIIGGCIRHAQSGEILGKGDHALENIEKMGELLDIWNAMHPVTVPPLSEEDKKFLEAFSNNNAGSHHTHSMMEMNGEMTDKLIEGDIIPSDQDIADMEERLANDESNPRKTDKLRARRAAPVTSATLWDRNVPIPFTLDSRYTDEQKIILRREIKAIEHHTCLNFTENGHGKPLAYMLADNPGSCNSLIGDLRAHPKSDKESQKIWLGKFCLNERSIIHETMHALGFHHTQTRTDRSDNIKLYVKNIIKNYHSHYVELPIYHSETNYGIPYEYNSVMHYPVKGGSQSIDQSQPILFPKDHDYIRTVYGKRPVFNDWKMVNLHYKCYETCSTRIECFNGGYQNPRECTQCVCPQFHTGTQCNEEKDVLTLISGEVEKLDFGFSLNLTAFNAPIEYGEYQRSKYRLIKAPEGTRIRVTINRISDFENFCPNNCDLKALEIVDGDLTRVGKRFCCRNATDTPIPHTFLSEKNVIGYHVFARAGLDFETNVTFSVEYVPVSPAPEPTTTDGPSTIETETAEPQISTSQEPQVIDLSTGSTASEESSSVGPTLPLTTEGPIDTGTEHPQTTESPQESETEKPGSEATTTTDTSTEQPHTNQPTTRHPHYYTTTDRPHRTADPDLITATRTETTTTSWPDEETESEAAKSLIDSIRSLLSEITAKLSDLADLVGV